jgi:hypothetical protein
MALMHAALVKQERPCMIQMQGILEHMSLCWILARALHLGYFCNYNLGSNIALPVLLPVHHVHQIVAVQQNHTWQKATQQA